MDNIRNWKMKCVYNSKCNRNNYTTNKIYEVVNLQFTCDDGYIFDLIERNIFNFRKFQDYSSSRWKLVEDKVEDKYFEIEKYLYKDKKINRF